MVASTAWSEWPELGTSARHCRTPCCLAPPGLGPAGPEAVRPERGGASSLVRGSVFFFGWADRGSPEAKQAAALEAAAKKAAAEQARAEKGAADKAATEAGEVHAATAW